MRRVRSEVFTYDIQISSAYTIEEIIAVFTVGLVLRMYLLSKNVLFPLIHLPYSLNNENFLLPNSLEENDEWLSQISYKREINAFLKQFSL